MKRLLTFSIGFAFIAAACTAGSSPTTTTTTSVNPPADTTADKPKSPDATVGSDDYKGAFTEGDCPFEIPDGTDPTCGTVELPEDSSDPTGPIITLAVAVFHSASAEPVADPIIYLDGGPGGRTLETIQYSFEDLVEPFLVNRDVVVYDQRGVGYSEPALSCPEALIVDFELLDDDISDTDYMDQYGAAIEACHDRVVADGVRTEFYNSAASATDLAYLRTALGYEQWNLFGISYGTRLALTTMRDHPEGIRSVILDGVVPPQIDTEVVHPAMDEDVMEALWAACASDSACGTAFPDLETRFAGIVETLNEKPVLVQGNDWLTGKVYDVLIDGDSFYQTIFGTLYSTSSIGAIPDAIAAAEVGEYSPFESMLSNDLTSEAFFDIGQHMSVRCHDETPFNAEADVAAALAAADVPQSEVPSFYNAICRIWDDTGQAGEIEDQAVTSDIPTLLTSGTLDPATPPAWAIEAQKTLTNSYLFEFKNMGHGVIPADDCPQSMALAFVNDPSTAPDDSCNQDLGYPNWITPPGTVEQAYTPIESVSDGEVAFAMDAPSDWDAPFDNVWVAPGLGDVAFRIDLFDTDVGISLPQLLEFLEDPENPFVVQAPIPDGLGRVWHVQANGEQLVLALEHDGNVYALTFFGSTRNQDRYKNTTLLHVISSLVAS